MRTCDRCNSEIIDSNDEARTQIDLDYPHQNICYKCYGVIQFSEAIARESAIKGIPPQQALQEWLELYD